MFVKNGYHLQMEEDVLSDGDDNFTYAVTIRIFNGLEGLCRPCIRKTYVCDSQTGDILLIIIRGMHLAEDVQNRSEAVYALTQTILEVQKCPRVYVDVGLYEKLKIFSDECSYKLTPQPDNDLLCLLSLVCLTPNADDRPTMLSNVQMFASKLIRVLDTSFTAIETALASQQTVQQLPFSSKISRLPSLLRRLLLNWIRKRSGKNGIEEALKR